MDTIKIVFMVLITLFFVLSLIVAAKAYNKKKKQGISNTWYWPKQIVFLFFLVNMFVPIPLIISIPFMIASIVVAVEHFFFEPKTN